MAVTVGDDPAARLPGLGLIHPADGPLLAEKEAAPLRALRLAHLRVELDVLGSAWAASLERAAGTAPLLGAALELRSGVRG